MVNQKYDYPDTENVGDEFDYSVWTPGTQLKLCNVPWNSDYRDIVHFGTQGALDVYLANAPGSAIIMENTTYAAFGRPIQIDAPFNRVNRFNYIRVSNPLQPIRNDWQKNYYYFITGIEYVAPNTTRIFVQLDVWQTFGYGVRFGNCYVERGHVGIANSQQFAGFGAEYLTHAEGLDIGGEYQIENVWSRKISSARTTEDYRILVMSAVALDVEPGDEKAPVLNSAKGSSFENLPNGCEYYLFQSLDHFELFMSKYSTKPWITQGILSIMAIPDEYPISTEAKAVNGMVINRVTQKTIKDKQTALAPKWRDDVQLGPVNAQGVARYRNLKKFLTFPYCVLELTSYTGTPIVLKPESWKNSDARIQELPHYASSGARVMFYPIRYNASDKSPITTDANGIVNDGGEFLDLATGIVNFPTFSLVNDGYMGFMASNVNGISFQNQSAEWSQSRALGGNALAFDQSSASIATSQQINRLGINAANAQMNQSLETAGFRAIQSGVNGALGSLGGGNILGAVGAVANSAAGYAIDVNQQTGSTAISNQLSRNTNNAQTGLQGYMRDSNKDYADYATKGDYQNAIAGIQARVQDARLTQPTTSGQVGGDAFNLARYQWGYDLKLKMLQPAAMRSVGEYWLRYGYQVNQFFNRIPQNLRVMEKFTYWKLRETYLTASDCPETYRQAIRGIFEKGVTVWKDPKDIGFIDIADNEPLEGILL